MLSTSRLVVLPDSTNSVGAAVIGCLFLIAAIGYMIAFQAWFNVIALFFAVIGALCVVYFWGTCRRPLPLPRIEIDNEGITSLALFHRRSISWSEISGLEEHSQERADGDDHGIRIWLAGAENGPADKRVHFDLDLGCFLNRSGDRFDATCEIADWLNEIRSCVASGASVISQARAPKLIRCVVA
jgi:hypothetical protein